MISRWVLDTWKDAENSAPNPSRDLCSIRGKDQHFKNYVLFTYL